MYKRMGTDLTSSLELAVVCGREGRTMARIGAYLTGAEQEQIPEIYSRLFNGEKIDEKSPATGIITSKLGRKGKISKTSAVDWFIEHYPKWSLPLQKKLKEDKLPRTRTILAYGLEEGRDFSDEFYIGVIRDVANLPEAQARNLYELCIQPQLVEMEESSGLIETEIKQSS